MTGFFIRRLARQSRTLPLLFLCAALVSPSLAQDTSKVTLESSEVLFSVLSSINHCGYDQELSVSDPVRAQVRAEIARAVANSEAAQTASAELCGFYRDHQQADPARTLAQYVSLALNMGEPPKFTLKGKEADLPPDAAYVLGFVPLVQRFYEVVNLSGIWQRSGASYSGLAERFHAPVSNLLLGVDTYLRMPISGYLGRQFTVLIEPMAAPGQVNSRNYGADYYIVVSPERGSLKKLDSIRHTYLHFIFDPMVAKRGSALKRLTPLLAQVRTAPLDDSYKTDVGLLLTESLIRAVEARTAGRGKPGEAARKASLEAAMSNGFILTQYFYDALEKFESAQEGFREVFPEWLFFIDVNVEKKRADNLVFASNAAPELMTATPGRQNLLDTAEQRMAQSDYIGARKLAQQALDQRQGDAGRALFLLAQTATLTRDAESAREYFTRALEVSHDPRILAWTHIYLGRMADMQSDREAALQHYRSALASGDSAPDTKTAAERGLQQPYAPQRSGGGEEEKPEKP
ncbi:MAG TPA: tetratricopeptide repeat protein [Terriglobales bacterium]|nr:tetratricopeptide repeat protein [Terriglobales bacterium]